MMFWVAVVVLTLIALAFVLPPLLRKPDNIEDNRREQNIQIAKQQLSELEAEFKEGRIEEISYQSSKDELEESLYGDLQTKEAGAQKISVSSSRKLTAIIVAVLVPVFAVGLYTVLGNINAIPESLKVVTAQSAQQGLSEAQRKQLKSVEGALASLEKKLKDNPNDLTGWVMLGRSYRLLGRGEEAIRSYEKAQKLKSDSPDILLPLADLLSSSNNGVLTGRPEALVQEALKVEPNSIMGLWLAGMAAEQRNADDEAIAYWKKLEKNLDPASPDRQEIRALIAKAGGSLESLPNTPSAQSATQNAEPQESAQSQSAPKAITVKVKLSDSLKDKVKSEDFVFIYAKAMSGPPMPLAAAKKQVKDLPLEIKLDDSMAMMPQMKLSNFSEVKVGARVSLTGAPQAQNGDFFSEKGSVKAGESVELEINQVVAK